LLRHGESCYETGQRAGQHPTFEFQRGGHNSLPSNQCETQSIGATQRRLIAHRSGSKSNAVERYWQKSDQMTDEIIVADDGKQNC
jgi:hypothetical protein